MSTVSTSLNSSATLLMSDYYRRFLNREASDKQCMRALYVSTILWGVLGTAMALALVKLTDSALDIWWTLAGIFGGGMCGLFLLGMISRRARNPAAIAGVLIGAALILWMSIPKFGSFLLAQSDGGLAHRLGQWLETNTASFNSPFHPYMVPVFGPLVILLVGLLLSSLWSWKRK